MSKYGTDESERQTVTCIGRGREGEGCGLVYGESGGVCDACGGMLLSSKALDQIKRRLK